MSDKKRGMNDAAIGCIALGAMCALGAALISYDMTGRSVSSVGWFLFVWPTAALLYNILNSNT